MGYYSWQQQEDQCVVCDHKLGGRQERYCSNACRQAHKRMSTLTREVLAKRECDQCKRGFYPDTKRQRFCSPDCSLFAADEAVKEREEAVCHLDGCEENCGWDGAGRARRYCSPAHRTKAYRLRKRAESAPESR